MTFGQPGLRHVWGHHTQQRLGVVCVCMYVCMYVCIYVCIYIYIYIYRGGGSRHLPPLRRATGEITVGSPYAHNALQAAGLPPQVPGRIRPPDLVSDFSEKETRANRLLIISCISISTIIDTIIILITILLLLLIIIITVVLIIIIRILIILIIIVVLLLLIIITLLLIMIIIIIIVPGRLRRTPLRAAAQAPLGCMFPVFSETLVFQA